MISDNIYLKGRDLRITVGISVLFILLLAGGAGAATLTVNASGGADYTRIQEAINSATAGDMIEVRSGTYNENIVISKDNISIKGLNRENTIINGGDSAVTVFLNGANNTEFSNFTLLNNPIMFFADISNIPNYNGTFGPAAYDSSLPGNYDLILQAIDARADPRQAWLILYQYNSKLQDKVVGVGKTFEMGPGKLNATVESIFAGSTIELMILNHTYLYNSGMPILSDARLILEVGNKTPVLYTKGGVDWQLEEGYILTVGGVDAKSRPRQVWIRLSKNGIVIEDKVLSEGESYSYYKNGHLVLSAKADKLFYPTSWGVWASIFTQIYQYSENTHNLLLNEPFHMFKEADVFRRNNWSLDENYNISVIGIDEHTYPKQVWIQLSKNGVTVDDKIIEIGDTYNYSKNGSLIITANVRDIFRGFESDSVILNNTYQYSDTTHNLLINKTSHTFLEGILNAVNWQLQQGYTLSAVDVDYWLSPNTVWLRLTKNGIVMDDQVLEEGESYTYSGINGMILSARVSTVFGGRIGLVNISNLYQYDENTGNTLLSDLSHKMIFGDIFWGERWNLYEGYTLTFIDIDFPHYRRAWIRLIKDNITVDDKILYKGDNYTYYKAGQLIFTAKLDNIYAGATTDAIQFRYVHQYSEIDGRPLISTDMKTLTGSGGSRRSKENIGILINNSHENKISNNLINTQNDAKGIHLIASSNNILSDNTANSNGIAGIYLDYSNGNMLSGNNASNNYDGISLTSSNNNTLSNNIASNNYYGIYMFSSSNNRIYLNNFINNNNNASSISSSNIWNLSQPIAYGYKGSTYVKNLGNYWGDYTGRDLNGDGIGDTAKSIGTDKDYYPLMQQFEAYIQTPTTTKLIMNETASTNNTLFETIISQNATLNTSVTGDLRGVLNFTNLEYVHINSGSFAGKGFSKGNWKATIEGFSREGYWQGMLFKKPEERKIYIKGIVSGGLKGIVEGYLIESVNGSGVYDQYQAKWTISQIGIDIVFAKINLNGSINYLDSVEYSSELYALQTSIEGKASGYYNGSLSTVLTHVRINNETNPYYGQGFSIISYVSEYGSGEGWTYDKLVSQDMVELNGLFTSPLKGIVSGTLDETGSPRKLSLAVERIDIGLPPAVDLKVKVWGPGRVSPGQTVDYIIEYRNDGLKAADDVIIFSPLDSLVNYTSASSGANYDDFFHTVDWNIGKVPSKTTGHLDVQVKTNWGLPQGAILENSIYIINVGAAEMQAQSQNLNLNPTDCNKNLLVNGINMIQGESGSKKWGQELTRELNAKWLPVYDGYSQYRGLRKTLLDSLNVELGTPGGLNSAQRMLQALSSEHPELVVIATIEGMINQAMNLGQEFVRTDYNGLTKPELTEGCYKNILAYSGGTRSVVTALQYDNLTTDRVILISPMSGFQEFGAYKQELEKILIDGKAKEIIIYQSRSDSILGKLGQPFADLLIQAKFDPYGNDAWFNKEIQTPSGQKKIKELIKINPETLSVEGKTIHIDRDEINKKNHSEIFLYINNAIVGKEGTSASAPSTIAVARDPNIKYGPEGFISPTQKLNYTVEYENEGEGIAFGVYFTDTLDEELNASTLEIGPVISTINGSVIAPPGTYNPSTRTITWLVGEVGHGEGGYSNISINVRSDAGEATEIINYATVYFPSVPETTRTNGIVSIVDITPPRYSNVNQSRSEVTAGESVEVSSYWQDGVQLNYTWLETNKSGTWQNVSYIELSGNEVWSNFTIQTTREGVTCWRVHANDTAGNENVTPVLCFNVQPDAMPPQSITNPRLQAAGTTWLNFTWLNPPDPDFSHVMLYLNGAFIANVTSPQNFYNITGLLPDKSYELGARTVDASGNINQTWINNTATTNSSGETRGDVNRNGRRDTGDATLILRYIVGLSVPSQYQPVLPIGDMNCNNRIDTGDATLILRDVVGLSIPRCWE